MEERIASPGPAASTRSRQAAAAARATASPPAAHDRIVSAPGAIRVRERTPPGASPRHASPAVAAAAAGHDAPVGAVGTSAESSRHPHQHMRLQMMVPRGKMGLLIGAQGKTIRELLHEAKVLRAHIQVPCLPTPEDGSGGEAVEAARKRHSSSGLVVITGPRDAVLKLKEKVAAIIAGQASAGSHDPLAYIAPYVQCAPGVSAVPKEAKRLLQLIQKLSTPPAGAGVERGPDEMPQNRADFENARGEALLATSAEMEQGAAPLDALSQSTAASGNETRYVDEGAFGGPMSSAQHRRALQPFASSRPPLPRASVHGSVPDISALRFKLDYVTQGLETMTRALGQLSMTLPQDLEPCPSEIGGPVMLDSSDSMQTGHALTAPLVIYSWRCLQHRVGKGAQEHPGRLEALLGADGVLVQVY